jgi:hypothetical protein
VSTEYLCSGYVLLDYVYDLLAAPLACLHPAAVNKLSPISVPALFIFYLDPGVASRALLQRVLLAEEG